MNKNIILTSERSFQKSAFGCLTENQKFQKILGNGTGKKTKITYPTIVLI